MFSCIVVPVKVWSVITSLMYMLGKIIAWPYYVFKLLNGHMSTMAVVIYKRRYYCIGFWIVNIVFFSADYMIKV